MIKTTDLTKVFGEFRAVDGLSLNIMHGEIYGFLGPNGAGKTTTILMILGIVRPTYGQIHLFGERFHPNRLDMKRRIGVVPEKHPIGMWNWMTAHEYLQLFADLYRVKSADARIKHLLHRVHLTEFEWKRVKEFSRGMLQKLSIVRALLHDPDILILDEPISGLDPLGIKEVRDLILAENREGRTIFISSHLLSEMEKICHRVAIISRGKLRAEGSMDSLLSKLVERRNIRVEVESISPDLVQEIKALEYVVDVSAEGNVLNIQVPIQGDYRKVVAQFLIDHGLVPLNMEQKTPSLEEAFTVITREHVEKITEDQETT